MKYISKFISLLTSLTIITSAFGTLGVKADAVQLALPYVNDFGDSTFTPTAATEEFNFLPQSDGVLVVEMDYVVTDSFTAPDGMIVLENVSGEKVAGWRAVGRGSLYPVVDGAFSSSKVNIGSWMPTTYAVKIEVDLTNNLWSATVDKKWDNTLTTNLSCSNAENVSKLKVAFPATGFTVDNLKIYKKVEATSGDTVIKLLEGESSAPLGNFTIGTAVDAGISFTSSDTDVATVNSTTGVVTAVGGGECTITATSNALYGYNWSYTVGVTTLSELIVITSDTNEIVVGDSKLLKYVIADGFDVGVISWSSDNISVANVNENGLVTGLKEGTANITASCLDGAASDTYTVIVKEKIQQQTLPYVNNFGDSAFTPTASVEEFHFTPQNEGVLVVELDYIVSGGGFNAADGLILLENESGEKVAGWKAVSRADMRPVIDGSFTGSDPAGSWTDSTYAVKIELDLSNDKWSATVNQKWDNTLTANLSCNNAEDVSKLKIAFPNSNTIDNLKIYKKAAALQTATSYDLTLGDTKMLGIDYTLGSAKDLEFSSSDSSVVAVDENGKITAANNGWAMIMAVNELNGISFNFAVSVTSKARKLTIDQKDRIIYTGETFRLSYSTPKYTKAGVVTWSSSDDNIAAVTDKGIVTGVAEGCAVITATSEYGPSADYIVEVVNFDDSTSVITMRNHNFELSGLYGWTTKTNGGTAPARVSGGANNSSYCVKLSGDSYVHQVFANTLQAGVVYTVSYMMKIASIGDGSQALFEIESSGYDSVASAAYNTVTDGWKKVRVDFAVPKGCVEPKIMLRLVGDGEVYYDDVKITKQKDMTEVTLFSDGLALNSIVSGAPLTTVNVRYVPKTSGESTLIAAIYEGDELIDCESRTVSAEQTLTDLVDLSKLDEKRTVGVMNWNNLSYMNPLDTKKTFLEKTQRSDVYNFFEINRMRGMYGGIGDIYDENIKSLITEKGINTLILNIIGTFYDGNVRKDMTALNKVLADAEKLADETGVKIFPKISYGDNATISNTLYGEYSPGYELTKTTTDAEGNEVVNVITSNAPCPRSREYWNAQVTDILSEVAKHKKLAGGVVDMEMYDAFRSRYPGSCMCDSCATDFDNVYDKSLTKQAMAYRKQYAIDNNFYDQYTAWHKSEIISVASQVRESVHKINADFIIGYMPFLEYLSGISEGLGTHQMPAMVFSEAEYDGNLGTVYVNQARIKYSDLPAVYTTGLSAEPNKVLPDKFAEKAVEAAANSMGYWIYSSNYIVDTGNTEEVKEQFISAIKSVNDTIDEKYGL